MALFYRKDNEADKDNSDDEIRELMDSLGSKDWKVRENAAIRLTEIGKPAIVPLLKALDSDNSMVQTGAAEVLGTYGEAALPTLMRLVTTGKERVRDGAARAIGQSGDSALKSLKKMARDKNYKARRGAALCLGYLGYLGTEIEELLLNALEDESEDVRMQAAASLENINWKPKRRDHMALFFSAKGDLDSLAKQGKFAIPALKLELSGSNIEKKKNIAGILPKINDDEALILLIGLLSDKESQIRQSAVEAVGNSGDRRLITYLVKALEDTDSYVRMEAAWALDRVRWKPSDNEEKARYLIIKEKWTDLLQMRETAIPILINSLKDENPAVRLKSTEVLRAMGNSGYAAINEAIKSEDTELKKRAIEAAALIKKKNTEKKEVKTEKKQQTPDEEVEEQLRRQKESAASKISSKESYWAAIMRKNGLDEERTLRLSKALSDDNEIIRAAAVESLKNTGNAGTECAIALLSDPKNNVRIAAIESLGDMKARQAAPYILRLTRDKNENIRMASAHSLGQIGVTKTLPGLIELFSDRSPGVRREASDSVAKTGNIALSLLKETFLEQDLTVRMTALRTVSRINDAASIALSVRMLNDSEYDVRDCAIKSLKILSENLFNQLIDESRRVLIQGTPMEKTGMIAALSGIEDLRAKEAMAGFVSDENEDVRKRAREALNIKESQKKKITESNHINLEKKPEKADSKYSDEITAIISELKSEDNSVQMKAAEKVFMIGDEIIGPLIESLSDENPAFQNFVAEILTGLGDSAIEGLIKSLKTGSTGLKVIAAQNLGKIPEEITINALCEVLYHESNPLVRKVAAESLGFMGDHRSVDTLIFSAGEEDKEVKSAAIRSLGYICDKKAIDTLIDAYNNDDHEITQMVTEALQNYGEDGIKALTDALTTEKDSLLREKIAQALDGLNWVPETEESISYYLTAKRNWNELEHIGEPAIGPLYEAYNNGNDDTRLNAMRTIIKIGGDRTILPVAKAVSDSSSQIRKEAVNAIMKIGKPAIPTLEEIVANADNPTERTFTMNLIRKLKE